MRKKFFYDIINQNLGVIFMNKEDLDILLKHITPSIEKAQKKGCTLSFITPHRDEQWFIKSLERSLDLLGIPPLTDDYFTVEREIGKMGFTFVFTKDNSTIQNALPELNPLINFFLVYGTNINKNAVLHPSQLRSLNAQKTVFFHNPKLVTNLDEILIEDIELPPQKTQSAHIKDRIKAKKSILPQLSTQSYSLPPKEHIALVYRLDKAETQQLFDLVDKPNFDTNYHDTIQRIKDDSMSATSEIISTHTTQTK